MQNRFLKQQLIVYGSFNFLPNPQTSILLTQALQGFELLPSLVNVQDIATGQVSPRVALQKPDAGIQIIFASDRIDVFQNMTDLMPFDHQAFVSYGMSVLRALGHLGLRYNRVGFVQESLVSELDSTKLEALRQRVLPASGNGSIEWTARWVDTQMHSEGMNVCNDLQRMTGVIMTPAGAQPFDGVKMMQDISTLPASTDLRFDNNNVEAKFVELVELARSERHTIGI